MDKTHTNEGMVLKKETKARFLHWERIIWIFPQVTFQRLPKSFSIGCLNTGLSHSSAQLYSRIKIKKGGKKSKTTNPVSLPRVFLRVIFLRAALLGGCESPPRRGPARLAAHLSSPTGAAGPAPPRPPARRGLHPRRFRFRARGRPPAGPGRPAERLRESAPSRRRPLFATQAEAAALARPPPSHAPLPALRRAAQPAHRLLKLYGLNRSAPAAAPREAALGAEVRRKLARPGSEPAAPRLPRGHRPAPPQRSPPPLSQRLPHAAAARTRRPPPGRGPHSELALTRGTGRDGLRRQTGRVRAGRPQLPRSATRGAEARGWLPSPLGAEDVAAPSLPGRAAPRRAAGSSRPRSGRTRGALCRTPREPLPLGLAPVPPAAAPLWPPGGRGPPGAEGSRPKGREAQGPRAGGRRRPSAPARRPGAGGRQRDERRPPEGNPRVPVGLGE